MPIPINPISLDLIPNEPTPLTVETLATQLNAVGLTCDYTTPTKLEALMRQVDQKINYGTIESFRIMRPTMGLAASRGLSLAESYVTSSQGNWQVKDTAYDTTLHYLQSPQVFDWLKSTDPSFPGISNQNPTDSLKATTVDAVKTFFVETLTMASSVVLKGINRDTLLSVLSNAISGLPKDLKDFNQTDSRAIFLVDNYNPSTKSADAIGVVSLSWTLFIKDYQDSGSNQPILHNTSLTVQARGLMFADINAMDAFYNTARTHFNHPNAMFFDIPIPTDNRITIYPNQPLANSDTFRNSLPLISKSTYLDHIVMFAPDLQTIASIDNTSSSNSITYEKSVAVGYTFTATQTVQITAGFEASIGVVKGSLSLMFSFSFSEQWSSLTTESINFTVPAGKKGFLYQGTLVSRILRYDPNTNTYTFMDMGMLKTTVFAVADGPILANTRATLEAENKV